MSKLSQSDKANIPTELRLQIVAQRTAGVSFVEIGRQFNVSSAVARYWCRKAIEAGSATREQLRMVKRQKERARLPDDEYNLQWVRRVKANTVSNETGCWIWQGNRALNGYGQTAYRGRTRILHRKMYEVFYGEILDRWVYACHHCDNKLCCNPEHLWKGTPKDNQVDCILKRRNSEQNVTHCPKGHPYDEKNTYWGTAASGRPCRNCKECARIRCRERYHRNIELSRARQRELRRTQKERRV